MNNSIINKSKLNGRFMKIYQVNENFFINETKEKNQLLGMLAADGSIVNNCLIISQSKDCGKITINYIKKILQYNGPIYEKITDSLNMGYTLQITSKKIINDLYNYGIKPKKTYTYELNDNIIDIKSFLRGYFEGDGSVGVYNNGTNKKYLISSFVGTKKFIEKIILLIPIKYSSVKNIINNLYEIRYNGNNAINFMNQLYSDEKLYKSYKYDIFNNYLKSDDYKRVFIKKNKYDIIKNDILVKITNNIKTSQIVKEIQEKYNIPFQTIYKYIKKYNNA